VILLRDRDPRLITIRRGGTLTDSDHRLLALWAAACAEHVLYLFESVQPSDPRPRHAIEQIRAWSRGEITMSQSRSAGGHAMAAARVLRGAARYAAFAAGQTGAVVHVAAHELGAAAYAIKAARAAASQTRPLTSDGSSAVGSANSSRTRSATWFLTISSCATRSAGRCSTSDSAAIVNEERTGSPSPPRFSLRRRREHCKHRNVVGEGVWVSPRCPPVQRWAGNPWR
jgi:hypothetical protein